MVAPVVFLIAASFMMSCAVRLQPKPWLRYAPRPIGGPVRQEGFKILASADSPNPQLQVAAPLDDGWKANIKATRISHQTFPPAKIDSIDPSLLLDTWAQPEFGAFEKPLESWDDENMTLQKMVTGYNKWVDATRLLTKPNAAVSIAESSPKEREQLRVLLAWRNTLEMVALVPGGLEIPFLESGSSAAHASVLALGMFYRDKLKDDSGGSVRKAFEEHGKQQTRPWLGLAGETLDVFMVEGLAVAPGIPEIATRVLLSKLEKYAHKEKTILVVAKRAYVGSDGSDLREFYVRLGFKKVEMEYGLPELVYTGTSSSATDEEVEKHQVMVGMNLWTGVTDLLMEHIYPQPSIAD